MDPIEALKQAYAKKQALAEVEKEIMSPKTIEEVKVGDTVFMVRSSTASLEPIRITSIIKKFERDLNIQGTYFDTGEPAEGYASLGNIISEEHQKFARETGLRADDYFDLKNPLDNKNPVNRLIAVMPAERATNQIVHYSTDKTSKASSSTSNNSSMVDMLKKRYQEIKPHTDINVGDEVETFNFRNGKIEAVIVQKIHIISDNCIFAQVQYQDGHVGDTTLSTDLENNKAADLFLKETGLKPGDSVNDQDWLDENNHNSIIHAIIASPGGGYEVCFRGKARNFSIVRDSSIMDSLREKHKNTMKLYAFNIQSGKLEECIEVIERGRMHPQIKFADGSVDFGPAATKEKIEAAQARFLLETGHKPGDKVNILNPGKNNGNNEIVAIIPDNANGFDICFKTEKGKGFAYTNSGYLAQRMRELWAEKMKEKSKQVNKVTNNLFDQDFNDEKFNQALNEIYQKNVLGGDREDIAKTVQNLSTQLNKMTEQLRKMTNPIPDRTHAQHPEKAKAVEDFVKAYQNNGNSVSNEALLKLKEQFKEFDLSLYHDFMVKDDVQGIEIVLSREEHPEFFMSAPLTSKRLVGFKPIIKPDVVPMNKDNPNRHVFKRGDKVQLAYNQDGYYFNRNKLTFIEKMGEYCRVRNDDTRPISLSGFQNVKPGDEFVILLNTIYHANDDLSDLKLIAEEEKKKRDQPGKDLLAKYGFELEQIVYYKNIPHRLCSTFDPSSDKFQIATMEEPGARKFLYVHGKELSAKPINIMSSAKKAAYRVGALQVKKLTKQVFLAILQKRMENAALFLDTEYGEALIGILSGIALSRVNHPKAQFLATEFQIAGMAQVGNAVADEVLDALGPIFQAMFTAASAQDDAGEARIALTERSAEESASALESDLGRQDATPIPLARAGLAR